MADEFRSKWKEMFVCFGPEDLSLNQSSKFNGNIVNPLEQSQYQAPCKSMDFRQWLLFTLPKILVPIRKRKTIHPLPTVSEPLLYNSPLTS